MVGDSLEHPLQYWALVQSRVCIDVANETLLFSAIDMATLATVQKNHWLISNWDLPLDMDY